MNNAPLFILKHWVKILNILKGEEKSFLDFFSLSISFLKSFKVFFLDLNPFDIKCF